MLTLQSHETESFLDFIGVEIPNNIESIFTSKSLSKSRKSIFKEQDKSNETLQNKGLVFQQRLFQEDIHQLLPERAPGLKISKSLIGTYDNEMIIVSPFHITEETCAGHMPGFPFLPLAEAGRVLAQVGAILVGYYAKTVEHNTNLITPLVYKVGEVLSGQQGYLVPNNSVCIIAKVKKLRGPLYAVEAHGYLDKQHIFSMPKISYFLSDDPKLWGHLG